MNKNKKTSYLLHILPIGLKRDILLKLTLSDVKKINNKYNFSFDTSKEFDILTEINSSLISKTSKYNNNFFKILFFGIIYTIVVSCFFITVYFTSPDGIYTVQKLLNSGLGHVFVFIPVIIFFKVKVNINFINELNIKKIKPFEIFCLLFCVIIISFSLYTANLLKSKTPFDSINDYYILSIILYPTFVALTEELIFRRYFYRLLRHHTDTITAMLVSSIFFILVHDPLNIFVSLIIFVDSILLTVLYEIKGNFILPVLAHSLANFSIMLIRGIN